MHGVKQTVARELWMEYEADEPAFEAVVDSFGKRLSHVRIDVRLIVFVDQVQVASGVVGKTPAIRKIPHVRHSCPARRVYVVITVLSARIGETHEILHLYGEAAFLDRGRQGITGDLALTQTCECEYQER